MLFTRYAGLVFLIICSLDMLSAAQVQPSGKTPSISMEMGGGVDDWSADYSGQRMYGPAAWAGAEVWRGLGILAEGHTLISGGDLSFYRYYVGEGGPSYAFRRWSKVVPYGKGEVGIAGLSVQRSATYRSHDTRTIWAAGGGVEARSWNHLWLRIDYTYDFFPGFLSLITLQKHTLNPNGISIGVSYHLNPKRPRVPPF